MRAKLKEIKEEMRQRRHHSIPEQGHWLRQVVTGFYAYHAVPTNIWSLGTFRFRIIDLWRRSLRRRSQKDGTTWRRITKLANDFLPRARILPASRRTSSLTWPARQSGLRQLTHVRGPSGEDVPGLRQAQARPGRALCRIRYRNRGGRRLRRQQTGGAGRHGYHRHLTANEIGRQRGKSIVLALLCVPKTSSVLIA